LDILKLQLTLVPDMLEVMKKRYSILQHIAMMQPIGRRSLSTSLGITERILRAEIDFLKNQGLVDVDAIGMKLTKEGIRFIEEVSPFIKNLFGIHELELALQKKLQINKVIIVPGDIELDPLVQKELGRATASYFRQIVQPNDIVALTGGSTLATVAEMVSDQPILDSVAFVPARGGMGEHHEYLANTVASMMAKKTGASYRLLHVPDQLSDEAYHSLKNETSIQEILKLIQSAGIVIHGIGQAKTMAIKRGFSEKMIDNLTQHQAVGEAFGYFFNNQSEIVHQMKIIGLKIEDLRNIPYVIAVAGGKKKAEAIIAVTRRSNCSVLVTDEGAAREMMQLNQ